jgi:hypothetical protein
MSRFTDSFCGSVNGACNFLIRRLLCLLLHFSSISDSSGGKGAGEGDENGLTAIFEACATNHCAGCSPTVILNTGGISWLEVGAAL